MDLKKMSLCFGQSSLSIGRVKGDFFEKISEGGVVINIEEMEYHIYHIFIKHELVKHWKLYFCCILINIYFFSNIFQIMLQ